MRGSGARVHIVVARYTENLDWLSHLSKMNVTVYNKGPPIAGVPSVSLPNVGREAHTYLFHIVHAYDSLPEYTAFVQGHPFDHAPDIVPALTEFRGGARYTHLGAMIVAHEATCKGSAQYPKVPLRETYETMYQTPAPDTPVEFVAGAQFVVHRDAILGHPRAFWERALAYATRDPGRPDGPAYAFERLWKHVFCNASQAQYQLN